MAEQGIVGRRRLAAILAGDVAGYSRLMAADESGTIAALDAGRAVFRAGIEAHHGRVIDMAGDSVLAMFDTATGAVSAALGVQQQLDAMAAGVPADRRLRFRIGVHLGEVVEKADGSVYGDGVNIAARIEGLALPGGVTVSDAVQGAVRHRIAATFEDLGEQQVKNIADPVHVYRVLAANGDAPAARNGAIRWIAAHLSQRRRMLAAGLVVVAAALAAASWQWWAGRAHGGGVVPITMSLAVGRISAPGGEAVAVQAADSLAQNLVTGIGAVERSVRVVSIDREANATATLRERARAAGARYLAEGELQSTSTPRQLSLRLIDTDRGALAWSHRFDMPSAAETLEAQVATRQVMAQLAGAVVEAEIRRVLTKPVGALDAMELLLRAVDVLDKGETLAAANEGHRLLAEALRLDPTLAEANITMIWALAGINELDPQTQRERYLREADEVSTRAVTLDPDSSRAWLSRAHALLGLGRWNASLQANERGIMLDPYSPRPYKVRAELLNRTGQPGAALPFTEKALAREPANPGGTLGLQCEAYVLLGDMEKAIHVCERATGLVPSDFLLYSYLAAAYANAGDLGHARATLAAMLKFAPNSTIARVRARRYSDHPEYRKLADKYWFEGLRKAGLPEQ